MISSASLGRGPIWAEFTRAQHGQVLNHLARAFHLPRAKVKAAVLVILGELTKSIDSQTLSRGQLARLVALLGKGVYEQVLETPTLLGATSTQVIGNEALTVVAGREQSKRIAAETAAASGVSPMIAEYLLPVVAAIFVGALAAQTRSGLFALMHGTADAAATAQASFEGSAAAMQFPVGRGSGSFSSSASGVARTGGSPATESLYLTLADEIRSTTHAPGKPDPLDAARRVVAGALGVSWRPGAWIERLRRWGPTALKMASATTQERLRKLRNRQRDRG